VNSNFVPPGTPAPAKPVLLAMTAVMMLMLAVVGVGCAEAAGWEYRGRVEMAGPVEKNLNLLVMTEIRSRNDLHTHNESHFSMGLEWKVNKWLALGPHYRHVTSEKVGVWRVEHRPYFDATLSWMSLGMSISNRNRLEYRMIEGYEAFRYRTRLTLKLPAAVLPGFQPYCSGEVFYAFDAGEINKTRLIAGFDLRVLGSVRLGVNYVLDSVKRAAYWQDLNALTVALKYKP